MAFYFCHRYENKEVKRVVCKGTLQCALTRDLKGLWNCLHADLSVKWRYVKQLMPKWRKYSQNGASECNLKKHRKASNLLIIIWLHSMAQQLLIKRTKLK